MQTLIIEDVSSVHAILVPLLRKDMLLQGLGHSVLVGDKVVDYGASFRLILTTRDASIAVTPDVAPLLTIANFTVTRAALEAQLLARTIQHELPQLESQRRCGYAPEHIDPFWDMKQQLLHQSCFFLPVCCLRHF